MILQTFKKRGLINPPKFLPDNTHYLVEVGSVAYGVAGGKSDRDVCGFCIPPKHVVFPWLNGTMIGFDKQYEKFEQWQCHGVVDNKRGYDFAISNIVKYFRLCMEGNPTQVEQLFVSNVNILHCTTIGQMVRDKRHMFLSKACHFKLKGYAYSQLHKIKNKDNQKYLKELMAFEEENEISHDTTYKYCKDYHNGDVATFCSPQKDSVMNEYYNLYTKMVEAGKRSEGIKIHGLDCKFAYHVYRLAEQDEQILREGDLTLDRKDRRETMKSIRRGEWTEQRIKEYFEKKEKILDDLYQTSTLRYSPDVDAIRELLMNCLEHHYGSIDALVSRPDKYKNALIEVNKILEEVKL